MITFAAQLTDSGTSHRAEAVNDSGESVWSFWSTVTMPTSGVPLPLESLKLWFKADSGHGGNPMNCWVDQTTNNFSAFHLFISNPSLPINRPSWVENGIGGQPAIHFQRTNAFSLPKFSTGWKQAEVFVVLQSFGPAPVTNQFTGLWLMGAGALAGKYPDRDWRIVENFGRSGSQIITGLTNYGVTNAHLYGVMSRNGEWTSRTNNVIFYTTGSTNVGFNDNPRLGLATNPEFFWGYISELMIFDRELTVAERSSVATNYLGRRFNLW